MTVMKPVQEQRFAQCRSCGRPGFLQKLIRMDPYKDPDEFIKNLGAEEYEKRIHAGAERIHVQPGDAGERTMI